MYYPEHHIQNVTKATARWSEWMPWSECSVTCHNGSRRRHRSCQAPTGGVDETGCVGAALEAIECYSGPCGGWSRWSVWSPCCHGKQERNRTCYKSEPGIEHCQGNASEVANCDSDECQLQPREEPGFKGSRWSEWLPWTPCSTSCGLGNRTRSRGCVAPDHIDGREVACTGLSRQTEACNGNITCPAPGVNRTASTWTDWSSWSDCSVDCGRGEKLRLRTCLEETCPGSWMDLQECIELDCESANTAGKNGTFVFMIDELSSVVSDISATESEETSRDELLKQHESLQYMLLNNTIQLGHLFSGQLEEVGKVVDVSMKKQEAGESGEEADHSHIIHFISTLTKKPKALSITPRPTPRPGHYIHEIETSRPSLFRLKMYYPNANVPGVTKETAHWSEWMPWSKCSVTCHYGSRRRHRSCQMPAGGVDETGCKGPMIEMIECNAGPCHVNGGWSGWGAWTPCCDGIQERHRECDNPAPVGSGERCHGIFMETLDCDEDRCTGLEGWSRWSVWSPCCLGQQERKRTCHGPEPSIVGCHGDALEVAHCDLDECHLQLGEEPGFTGSRWSEWLPWTPCSTSCGPGNRTRTHRCITPYHVDGREATCTGPSKQTEVCNGNVTCQGKKRVRISPERIRNFKNTRKGFTGLLISTAGLLMLGFMVLLCIAAYRRLRRRGRKPYKAVLGESPELIDWD
ncbi:A disintegrin and metalloproteinase with thrombospondin motifs adt-1-like isoform X2 [Ptychodera flava]|uniref:A disintegrin and metalloproteinase with thrombospondin motifs adt-1-like isoform X2 n=1 Tax=Ptychodera flava TaxID=63121 RepID=UPI00396A86B8